MTLLELLFTLASALTGSAVFQFFLAKSRENDVDRNVMLQTGGTLFGIIGAFALLSHFFLPDPEIRKLVGIGVFVIIIALFHRARLQLRREQEHSK